MAKRRARGTGSIRHDARRGVWVGRAPVGKLPGGRTRYREVSGATQAEVVRKLRAVEPATDATTVAAWSQRWLQSLSVRVGTRESYETNLRTWILPAWGSWRLSAVTPSAVERLVADMQKQGKATGTISLALDVARVLFNAAVRDGLIPRNPVSVARKPKKTRKKIDPLTPSELRQVIDAATCDRTRPLALMAAIGCRIGECLALDVSDWDGERVSITKTVGKFGRIGQPKSANGIRTVRVPPQARHALETATAGRTAGPLWGEPRLTAKVVRQQWYRLLRRLGLRRRNPHALRHSVATAAIAAGVPIGNVARDLGDTVGTIVATYLHATNGADVADVMGRLLGGI